MSSRPVKANVKNRQTDRQTDKIMLVEVAQWLRALYSFARDQNLDPHVHKCCNFSPERWNTTFWPLCTKATRISHSTGDSGQRTDQIGTVDRPSGHKVMGGWERVGSGRGSQ